MAPNSEKHNRHDHGLADDDLGSLIRWSLKSSLERESPPDDLWPKIRARIEPDTARAEPSRVRPKLRALSLAPLIQTIVASSLVLAFVLGTDRGGSSPTKRPVSQPRFQRTVVLGSDRPQDIPRIHITSHTDPEQVVRQRIGGFAE